MYNIVKRVYKKNGSFTDYKQLNIKTGNPYVYFKKGYAQNLAMEMNNCEMLCCVEKDQGEVFATYFVEKTKEIKK